MYLKSANLKVFVTSIYKITFKLVWNCSTSFAAPIFVWFPGDFSPLHYLRWRNSLRTNGFYVMFLLLTLTLHTPHQFLFTYITTINKFNAGISEKTVTSTMNGTGVLHSDLRKTHQRRVRNSTSFWLLPTKLSAKLRSARASLLRNGKCD